MATCPGASVLDPLSRRDRIGSLLELLEYPDADFFGCRASGLPKLVPKPDEFLLSGFFHGGPPSQRKRTYEERTCKIAVGSEEKGIIKMTDNTQKNPKDWVSGSDPMTGAQGSYLKTLSDQAHKPDPTREDLTKAEASELIDELREDADLSKGGK